MQSCQSSWVVYRLLASVIAQAYRSILQHNIGRHDGICTSSSNGTRIKMFINLSNRFIVFLKLYVIHLTRCYLQVPPRPTTSHHVPPRPTTSRHVLPRPFRSRHVPPGVARWCIQSTSLSHVDIQICHLQQITMRTIH